MLGNLKGTNFYEEVLPIVESLGECSGSIQLTRCLQKTRDCSREQNDNYGEKMGPGAASVPSQGHSTEKYRLPTLDPHQENLPQIRKKKKKKK